MRTRLRPDALRVESFAATRAAPPARGTVRANGDAAVADDEEIVAGSANRLCTTPSYLETCIFYTCGGCTTADPEYC